MALVRLNAHFKNTQCIFSFHFVLVHFISFSLLFHSVCSYLKHSIGSVKVLRHQNGFIFVKKRGIVIWFANACYMFSVRTIIDTLTPFTVLNVFGELTISENELVTCFCCFSVNTSKTDLNICIYICV